MELGRSCQRAFSIAVLSYSIIEAGALGGFYVLVDMQNKGLEQQKEAYGRNSFTIFYPDLNTTPFSIHSLLLLASTTSTIP